MQADVLDVLLFVFENYIDSDAVPVPRATMEVELQEMGFPEVQVRRAMCWLDDLDGVPEQLMLPALNSIRVYSDYECKVLDAESRGFIMYLERVGIIDAAQREYVVDRALALDIINIDVEQTKWIVLMVLHNSTETDEEAYGSMEDLVYDELEGDMH